MKLGISGTDKDVSQFLNWMRSKTISEHPEVTSFQVTHVAPVNTERNRRGVDVEFELLEDQP